MLRVLTASQMREADRLTTEAGVPGIVLMENAASRVVEAMAEVFAPLAAERILILCGKGNNGGDGLAIARQLRVRGLSGDCAVVLLASKEELGGDAALNLKMLEAVGVELHAAADFEAWRALRERTLRTTLVVDAMLGTGLSGPARGLIAEVIRDLRANYAHARFVAVDMPSGMPSDTGERADPTCPADLTVTFTAHKVSQAVSPNCGALGELRLGRIGTSEELLARLPGDSLWLTEPSDVAPLLAPRDRSAHKGDFGHVAIVAGSRSKPGAAVMAGAAAARSGAGLTTVISVPHAASLAVGATAELMTIPAQELEDGSMGDLSVERSWFDRAGVVALGPGLGVAPENQALVKRLVAELEQPLVVDADGLTALAGLDRAPWPRRTGTLVLTPHPGEMARLTGMSSQQVQADRIGVARAFAQRQRAYVVLKGDRTLIALPDGRVLINPTGTPGMASGGSGDVLLGMIAGFLAQFLELPPENVIAAAVFLHGLAGEKAAADLGELSMLATDILNYFPDAIRETTGP